MTLVIELQWKRARLFIGRDSGKKKEKKKKKKKRRIPVVARERVSSFEKCHGDSSKVTCARITAAVRGARVLNRNCARHGSGGGVTWARPSGTKGHERQETVVLCAGCRNFRVLWPFVFPFTRRASERASERAIAATLVARGREFEFRSIGGESRRKISERSRKTHEWLASALTRPPREISRASNRTREYK